MQTHASWAIGLLLLGLTACASGGAGTWVAVRNAGSASIDASISDGTSELRFDQVAAGTTSNVQSVKFAALSGLTVNVGDVTSTISLNEGQSNVVGVDAGGKVSGVTIVAAPSAVGSSGW